MIPHVFAFVLQISPPKILNFIKHALVHDLVSIFVVIMNILFRIKTVLCKVRLVIDFSWQELARICDLILLAILTAIFDFRVAGACTILSHELYLL